MTDAMLARFDELSRPEHLDRKDPELLKEVSEFWGELFCDQRLSHLKFCRTCKIRRLPKSSHCRFCDNCVVGFDHHCFWIGHCVGARNHRAFVAFLVAAHLGSVSLGMVAFIDCCWELFRFLGTNDSVKLNDWRIIAMGILVLLAVATALSRKCLQRRPQPRRRRDNEQHTPPHWLHTRQGQSSLRSATSTAFMILFLAGFVLFGLLLPWQPVLLLFLTIGPVLALHATLQLQIPNLGRGLNVKFSKTVRSRQSFSWGRVLGFFATPPLERIAPLEAEIGEEDLDSEFSDIFSEKEPDDDFCTELGQLTAVCGLTDDNLAGRIPPRNEPESANMEPVSPSPSDIERLEVSSSSMRSDVPDSEVELLDPSRSKSQGRQLWFSNANVGEEGL